MFWEMNTTQYNDVFMEIRNMKLWNLIEMYDFVTMYMYNKGSATVLLSIFKSGIRQFNWSSSMAEFLCIVGLSALGYSSLMHD